VREAFRLNKVQFASGFDYVVIAKPVSAGYEFATVVGELDTVAARFHGGRPTAGDGGVS
jgi:RNase P protein component